MILNDLRVLTVILLAGPAPAAVFAISRNKYRLSGDNPPTVPISMLGILLPKLSMTVASKWSE